MRARSASAGRWARPSSGMCWPAPPRTRFAGAVVIDMTARVRNDDEWDLGLSPEACEARSHRDQRRFRELRADRRPGDLRPAGGARAPQARRLGEPPIRPQRRRRDRLGLGLADPPGRARLARPDRAPDPDRPWRRSALYGDDTADHLVAALPHARAVRFERSGHAPHLEEPELFNAILKDFADRLSLARTPQTFEFVRRHVMTNTLKLTTAIIALAAFAAPRASPRTSRRRPSAAEAAPATTPKSSSPRGAARKACRTCRSRSPLSRARRSSARARPTSPTSTTPRRTSRWKPRAAPTRR